MKKNSIRERGFSLIFSLFVITLYLQTGCSLSSQSSAAIPALPVPDYSEAIAEADRLFQEREDIEKIRRAVEMLGSLRNPEQRNYEVEWKFAKCSYFLGKRLENEKEKEAVFEKGRDAGKIASRIHADKPDGFFWYAANLGELSKISPVTIGIKSIDDIREAMQRVIELDPDYQGASAFDALAQVELKSRLFGGKAEKAVEYLEKAIELEKQNSSSRVNLAEAYLAVKRDADARKQLDHVLKMEPHPDFKPEHEEAVKKAKELLKRNF